MWRPFALIKPVAIYVVQFLLDTLGQIFFKIAEWESNQSYLPILGMPMDPSRIGLNRRDFYWANLLSAHPGLDEALSEFRPLSFKGESNNAKTIYRALIGLPWTDDIPKIERTLWWKEGLEYVKDYGYQGYYIKPYSSIFLLPNWVESKINLLIHYNESITVGDLDEIRAFLVLGMFYYQYIGSIKTTIEISFIGFNPYMNPITTVWWASYDWIDHKVGHFFPVWFGIPWSNPVFFGALAVVRNRILRLFITAPYLPSEAVVGYVKTNDGMQNVLYFKGLPQEWDTYGIPNADRLDWYFNNPHILEYMYKHFGEETLKLVPDYIPAHFLLENSM